MAPNGKPASFVMQQQKSPVHSIQEQVTKDTNIRVKSECILFSQSVVNGRWSMSGNSNQTEQTSTTQEGPEPRVLSKKRRDLINAEIRELQNLLPLKKSARERLSYLGILALTNTFIRKATFFNKECFSSEPAISSSLIPEFSSSLYGFMLVFNREGKILYTSDNILDYLGNTVVELASQGDSIYDFVDKEDHDQIRAQLDVPPYDDRGEARKLSFFCRMSTSRYMKTQMRSWKNKIVHVTGRYYKPATSNDWSETVFFAVCTPIESKPVADVRHHPSPRVAEFKALHSADMQFLEVSGKVEDLLGYKKKELENTSWYRLIYPDDLEQAKQQHIKFVKEDGSNFSCVLRMIKKDGTLTWVDITAEKSQESVGSSFVCNYIIIEEDEVPYFRIHHNLLPFPEHYSDAQRQYLAYRSTLLSAALHNELASATSAMTSSGGYGHVDSSQFSLAHQLYAADIDTKTILRRQLMKRKITTNEISLCSAPAPYLSELYGVPPNKMLIRSASELQYPNTAAYHVPLQHSSSFPDGALHPHMLYRGISSEDAYLSQFHNPNATRGFLFESSYAPLSASRKHSFTFHPSQRSPVLQSTESVSSVNGNSIQHNQNNNAQRVHHEDQYYTSTYSPLNASKCTYQDTTYSQSVGSPHSLIAASPSSPAHHNSPVHHTSFQRNSVDEMYYDHSNASAESFEQIANSSVCGRISSSPNNQVIHRQCSVSSFSNAQNNGTVHHGNRNSPIQSQISCPGYSSSPTYTSQCDWNQTSYQNDAMQPTNLSTHPLKEEMLVASQCDVINPHTSSSRTMIYPESPYHHGSVSPARSSPCAYPTSPCSQMVQDGYNAAVVEKPYQIQYSITSSQSHPMQSYPSSSVYTIDQVGNSIGNGYEWEKKCRNVSNLGMAIPEIDVSHRLA